MTHNKALRALSGDSVLGIRTKAAPCDAKDVTAENVVPKSRPSKRKVAADRADAAASSPSEAALMETGDPGLGLMYTT